MEITYIPKQQSTAIKAIAMLLIVLGHNHILAPQEAGHSELFEYLYKFHVSIFFILPFFYDHQQSLDWASVKKILAKCGIPYILFFAFSYFVYHFAFLKDAGSVAEFFGGLVGAPGCGHKLVTGFVFLWFLPVFMLMSLFKLVGSWSKWLMALFFSAGFVICVWSEAYVVMWHSPFYVLKALYYYSMGLSCCFVARNVPHAGILGVVSFLVLSVLYWMGIFRAGYFCFSLSAFLSIKWLTSIVDFSRFRWLLLIGQYSLSIYLVHVFIYNVLERLLPNSLLAGMVIYVLTILFSLAVSLLIYKVTFLRQFIFPQTWNEWISALHLRGKA